MARKDWRKPYYRSGRFDPTCRPHGSCPWCARARQWNTTKKLEAATEQEREWGEGDEVMMTKAVIEIRIKVPSKEIAQKVAVAIGHVAKEIYDQPEEEEIQWELLKVAQQIAEQIGYDRRFA